MSAKKRDAIDHKQWPEVLAFAEALVRERKKRKISQKMISERTGLPQPYLSQLENGFLNPTLQVQAVIARAVGIPLTRLAHTKTVKVDVNGEVIQPDPHEQEASPDQDSESEGDAGDVRDGVA